MHGETQFDRLIGLIYDAAAVPERWSAALEAVGDALGGCAFVMSILESQEGPRFVTGARVDPDQIALIEQRYARPETNPLVAAMPRLPVTTPVAREAIQADPEYLRGELYNEVFRPQGLVHAAVACVLRTPDCTVPLGVLRQTGSGRPDQRDLDLLARLLPHMQRSVQLYLRLQQQERPPPTWTLELLDGLPWGVILLDGTQRPVVVNREAARILGAADGLRLDRRGLFADHPEDSHRLRTALNQATASGNGHAGAGADLQMTRPSGAAALLLTIVPLGRRVLDRAGASSLRAAVHIVDPAKRPVATAERLRTFYGLTPAEATLGQALAAGRTLQEYADEARLTTETARWRLKQVLAKTDTHRQAELVRLLLTSAVLG